MNFDPHDEYARLTPFYEALDAVLGWPDDVLFGVNEAVSGWSPAQHVYHIAVANGRMGKAIEAICARHPMVDHEGFLNDAGRQTIASGTFPRGRTQAPPNVRPPDVPTRADLDAAIARSRQKHADLAPLIDTLAGVRGGLPHPFLGVLSAAEWLRLIRIHAEHHLAIIREIAGESA